jgi:Tfp pilus assembly protein PilF
MRLNKLGLSYLGLNDLKQAQLHFEEAIKLESNYLNALAEIGN